MMTQSLIVGLTGGIASGKSTVSDEFRSYGIDVVDTDVGAREVVKKGTLGLEKIIAHFGRGIVLQNTSSDNVLDRQKLRRIVFEDEKERQWLNKLLHPLIREWVHDQTSQTTSRYVIHAIPLLIESKLQSSVDVIVTVDVPEELQIQRYLKREGPEMEEQCRRIMSRQCSRGDRIAYADFVIDNSGSIDDVREEIRIVHESLLELCDRREF